MAETIGLGSSNPGAYELSEQAPGARVANPDKIIEDVVTELTRATLKFGPFKSAHEGYAVLLEETDELWDEIKGKHNNRRERIRAEAVQVAAMAVRLIMDVCDNEDGIIY